MSLTRGPQEATQVVHSSGIHCGMAWLRRSRVLGALGISMILTGIALIIVGAIVPNGRVPEQQQYSNVLRNEEGVPQLGAQGHDVVNTDCQNHLHNRDGYEESALGAETALFGKEVSTLSLEEGKEILGNLSQFSVSISFWVLHSYSVIDKSRIQGILDKQLAALNKAFAGANVHFTLHGRGVYFVQVDEKTESNCHDKGFTKDLLGKMNSLSSLVVFVCNLEEVNGLSAVYGDSFEPGDEKFYLSKSGKTNLGVIYTRLSALNYSPTSLVHQMGHVFGLPHPFPSYETCKVDGDFIADTQPVYRGSEACNLKETPFCDPSRVKGEHLFLPGNLYMDTSPDICRNTFTPGQVLRMHAMIADMVLSRNLEYIQRFHHDDVDEAVPIYTLTEPFEVAWQSDIPEYSVLESQMETYFEGMSVKEINSSLVGHSNPFTRNTQYAMLATRENTDDKALSTCFPKESENTTFWVGELKSTIPIAGIELTQALDSVSRTSIDKPVEILVQVASSLGRYQNCTEEFIPLDSLTNVIRCQEIFQGGFIKIFIVGNGQSNLCVEQISVLSSVTDVQISDSISNTNAILSARQSSTMEGLTADKSISSSENILDGCSSTQAGKAEQWRLKLNRPFLIHSFEFEYAACSTTIASFSSDSKFLRNAAQALQICMSPNAVIPLRVSFSLAGASQSAIDDSSGEALDFCSNTALVVPGNLKVVNCRANTLVKANTIQVKYSGPLERPVTLCNAHVHAFELVALATLASLGSQEIYPPSIEDQYIRALDNNDDSCITVRKGIESYWKVYFKVCCPIYCEPLPFYPSDTTISNILQDKTDINAIILLGRGEGVQIQLLDESDDTLWNTTASLPDRKSTLTRVPSVPASSLTLSGFTKLCNILVGTSSVRI